MVVDTSQIVFQRHETFFNTFDTDTATHTSLDTHLAGVFGAVFISAGNKEGVRLPVEFYDTAGAGVNAITTARAFFFINERQTILTHGHRIKGTAFDTLAKTQTTVETELVTTAADMGRCAIFNSQIFTLGGTFIVATLTHDSSNELFAFGSFQTHDASDG
jgi:hypothetical protein